MSLSDIEGLVAGSPPGTDPKDGTVLASKVAGPSETTPSSMPMLLRASAQLLRMLLERLDLDPLSKAEFSSIDESSVPERSIVVVASCIKRIASSAAVNVAENEG